MDQNPPLTNHTPQTFELTESKFLFLEGSAKMTDGSEERKRKLAFELRSSHVIEKHSNLDHSFSVNLPCYESLDGDTQETLA